MPGYTVGRFARRFGLSRSTLLYYDRLGLVSPRGRDAAGYRLYGEREVQLMERVMALREAGLSLAAIRELLAGPPEPGTLEALVAARLDELSREIRQRREQQRLLLALVQGLHDARPPMVDKDQWVALLRSAGLDDEGLHRWHQAFEQLAPEAHQAFLESLAVDPDEIRQIRAWSRQGA